MGQVEQPSRIRKILRRTILAMLCLTGIPMIGALGLALVNDLAILLFFAPAAYFAFYGLLLVILRGTPEPTLQRWWTRALFAIAVMAPFVALLWAGEDVLEWLTPNFHINWR
jgi:hypothetical protein